jgi:hypothetical protein
MARKPKVIANVRVGHPDTRPWRPSHVRGIREGNEPGSLEREPGFVPDPVDRRFARATARRSTGINPRARNPIFPSMPNLPPA